MNRIKQIQKAWKQNEKIRKVPYWKTDWMNRNASSQGYESCMKEYEENQEYIANWKRMCNFKNPAVYRY